MMSYLVKISSNSQQRQPERAPIIVRIFISAVTAYTANKTAKQCTLVVEIHWILNIGCF